MRCAPGMRWAHLLDPLVQLQQRLLKIQRRHAAGAVAHGAKTRQDGAQPLASLLDGLLGALGTGHIRRADAGHYAGATARRALRVAQLELLHAALRSCGVQEQRSEGLGVPHQPCNFSTPPACTLVPPGAKPRTPDARRLRPLCVIGCLKSWADAPLVLTRHWAALDQQHQVPPIRAHSCFLR